MDRETRHALFRLLDGHEPPGPGERDALRLTLYRLVHERGQQLDDASASYIEVLLDEFAPSSV